MDAFSEALGHLYKQVLQGALLEQESSDYVSYLTPPVSSEGCLAAPSGGDPGGQDPALPASPATPLSLRGPSPKAGAHERALLQLTVIQVMVARVFSAETQPRCKEKYREILNILLNSSEVDLKLTSLIRSRDKLLSHLAAKCLGLLLHYQLREEIPLRDSWLEFCHTSLGEPLAGSRVACCLWVLSAVIKEILKDPGAQKTESLRWFLAPLDTILEDFYDPFFTWCFANLQDPSESINPLLAFLDLLELLAASRPHLELPQPCQRLLFQKPARLLDVIMRPVPAFVSRKCVLVLKKCLLGKVGEDLTGSPLPTPLPSNPHLEVDMAALANVVLQAVDSGLLRTLSVHGQVPHFGGEGVQPGAERVLGSDQVMLRAASLLVVRAFEVKLQRCAAASEGKGALRRFMAELLSFLDPHLQPALQSDHPCAWVSRVFIEQDDDMLEAAKASLGIYLQLTRADDTCGKAAWARDMHASGCDPHCIFLSVLGTVGFDPTTLLDFLISSETCFLEYFVRYLKLLQRDWAHFMAACTYWEGQSPEVGVCDDKDARGPRKRGHPEAPGPGAAGSGQGDGGGASPGSLSPARPARSLVAYDSSSDSEEEMPGLRFSHRPEMQGTARKDQAGEGRAGEPRSSPVAVRDAAGRSSAACGSAPGSSAAGRALCCRTVRCLGRLRRAVARLHRRSLFPYNPAALLRLLRHIEAIHSQGHPP